MGNDQLIEGVFSGNPRSIARAISLVESNAPGSAEMMKAIYARTGKAFVIGITGSPGAGKSSLVDKLAIFYRDHGEKVGILCVDPSSPFSG
ncbi:methylmalonyl Co-A mutase-associated GTPase MeaB, partial [Escherichia coli]|nr:methylmalonyl Co-A mutase-associated GTPase MeaB [Escherichia coli]